MILLVVLLEILSQTSAGAERFGLTTFGEECLDACSQRGFPFAWCHKRKSRNGTFIDRDYCSPVYGTTRYLETCTDSCERREGKPFFWCHTYPTSRGDWDYCSPFPEDFCSWGTWGSWGRCSTTCGPGTRSRRRRVEGANGRVGKCSGETEVVFQSCSETQCLGGFQSDCEWGEWSNWSLCTVSCGEGGVKKRYRVVERQERNGGGCAGDTTQFQPCPFYECPVFNIPETTTRESSRAEPRYLGVFRTPGDINDAQNTVVNGVSNLNGKVYVDDLGVISLEDFTFKGDNQIHFWVGGKESKRGEKVHPLQHGDSPIKGGRNDYTLVPPPQIQDVAWLAVRAEDEEKDVAIFNFGSNDSTDSPTTELLEDFESSPATRQKNPPTTRPTVPAVTVNLPTLTVEKSSVESADDKEEQQDGREVQSVDQLPARGLGRVPSGGRPQEEEEEELVSVDLPSLPNLAEQPRSIGGGKKVNTISSNSFNFGRPTNKNGHINPITSKKKSRPVTSVSVQFDRSSASDESDRPASEDKKDVDFTVIRVMSSQSISTDQTEASVHSPEPDQTTKEADVVETELPEVSDSVEANQVKVSQVSRTSEVNAKSVSEEVTEGAGIRVASPSGIVVSTPRGAVFTSPRSTTSKRDIEIINLATSSRESEYTSPWYIEATTPQTIKISTPRSIESSSFRLLDNFEPKTTPAEVTVEDSTPKLVEIALDNLDAVHLGSNALRPGPPRLHTPSSTPVIFISTEEDDLNVSTEKTVTESVQTPTTETTTTEEKRRLLPSRPSLFKPVRNRPSLFNRNRPSLRPVVISTTSAPDSSPRQRFSIPPRINKFRPGLRSNQTSASTDAERTTPRLTRFTLPTRLPFKNRFSSSIAAQETTEVFTTPFSIGTRSSTAGFSTPSRGISTVDGVTTPSTAFSNTASGESSSVGGGVSTTLGGFSNTVGGFSSLSSGASFSSTEESFLPTTLPEQLDIEEEDRRTSIQRFTETTVFSASRDESTTEAEEFFTTIQPRVPPLRTATPPPGFSHPPLGGISTLSTAFRSTAAPQAEDEPAEGFRSTTAEGPRVPPRRLFTTTIAPRIPPGRTTPESRGVSNFLLLNSGTTEDPFTEPTESPIRDTTILDLETEPSSPATERSTRRSLFLPRRRPGQLPRRPGPGRSPLPTRTTPAVRIRNLKDIFNRRRSTTLRPTEETTLFIQSDGELNEDEDEETTSLVDVSVTSPSSVTSTDRSFANRQRPSIPERPRSLGFGNKDRGPLNRNRLFKPRKKFISRFQPKRPFLSRKPTDQPTELTDQPEESTASSAADSDVPPAVVPETPPAPAILSSPLPGPFTTPITTESGSGSVGFASGRPRGRPRPPSFSRRPFIRSTTAATTTVASVFVTPEISTKRMSDDERFQLMADFMKKNMEEVHDASENEVEPGEGVTVTTPQWESGKVDLTATLTTERTTEKHRQRSTDPTVTIRFDDIEEYDEYDEDEIEKTTKIISGYNPCDIRGSCGPNAECEVSPTNTPLCTCPTGFSGIPRNGQPDPQHGCVRTPLSCAGNGTCPAQFSCEREACLQTCDGDSECALGERCITSGEHPSIKVCIKICFYDAHCLAGEYCEENVCRAGCQSDSNCPFGQICGEGECVDGCNFNNDCPLQQECKSGTCSDPCLRFQECGTNAVCRAVNHLATCTCPTGFKELNSPYDACVDEHIDLTKLECLTDSDCASGVCSKGVCRGP